MRSASASEIENSPRNSVGSEMTSSNFALNAAASSADFVSFSLAFVSGLGIWISLDFEIRIFLRHFLEGRHHRFERDLILKFHQGVQERFGSGWATGDIDIHGQNAIHSLKHGIAAIHASG